MNELKKLYLPYRFISIESWLHQVVMYMKLKA